MPISRPAEHGALREIAAREIARARGDSACATGPAEIQRLWDELVGGRWALLDQFVQGGRRHLIARRRRSALGRAALTPAEMISIATVVDGRPQKVAAAELGVAESTISTHVRRAMRKLGLATRADLARAFGVRRGG
jgi:DNA-binding CsgD family transcriptional regulator